MKIYPAEQNIKQFLILSLDNKIEVVPKKKYIAFKTSTNFIDILPQTNKIKFCFLFGFIFEISHGG